MDNENFVINEPQKPVEDLGQLVPDQNIPQNEPQKPVEEINLERPAPTQNIPQNERPETKKSLLKIIITTIVGLFILGGLAFGSWYGYENYFAMPKLSDLLYDSMINTKDINLYKIDYKLNIELGKIDKSEQAMVDSILGEGEKSLNLKGSISVDKNNLENIKSESNFFVSDGATFGKLSLEIKNIDHISYLKLTDIPAAITFIDKDIINIFNTILKDKWIKIDQKDEDGLLSKYNEIYEKEKENTKNNAEKINEIFQSEDVMDNLFKETKECVNEEENNTKVINCQFRLSGQALKNLLEKYDELPGTNQELTKALKDIKAKEWETFNKTFEQILFDVTFLKKEHRLVNFKVSYKSNDDKISNFTFEMKINELNTPLNISAPAEAEDINVIIGLVFSAMMGGTKSSIPTLPVEENGINEALDNINTDMNTDMDSLLDSSDNEPLENIDPDLDTDMDGLSDTLELYIYNTDINNPDSDGDGYSDGDEVNNGYNPNGPGNL